MEYKVITARDINGVLIPDGIMTVYEADGTTPVTSVYDINGNDVGNDLTVDIKGRRGLAMPDGEYVIVVTSAAHTTHPTVYRFYDAQAADALRMKKENAIGTVKAVRRIPGDTAEVSNAVVFLLANGEYQRHILTQAGTLISVEPLPHNATITIDLVNADTFVPNVSMIKPLAFNLALTTFKYVTQIKAFGCHDGVNRYAIGKAWDHAYRFYGGVGAIVGGDDPTILSSTEKVTIGAPANSTTWLDLTGEPRTGPGAGTNGSRIVIGGGHVSTLSQSFEFFEIAPDISAAYFETLSAASLGNYPACGSGQGYALFGGYGLDLVSLSDPGQATALGNLLSGDRSRGAAGSNGISAFFGGGYTGVNLSSIEQVTIGLSGVAESFGNLSIAKRWLSGIGNTERILFAGGFDGTVLLDAIEYIVADTPADATSFGALSSIRNQSAAMTNNVLGLIAGGGGSYTVTTIEYVHFSTPGNAISYGDLVAGRFKAAGTSAA